MKSLKHRNNWCSDEAFEPLRSGLCRDEAFEPLRSGLCRDEAFEPLRSWLCRDEAFEPLRAHKIGAAVAAARKLRPHGNTTHACGSAACGANASSLQGERHAERRDPRRSASRLGIVLFLAIFAVSCGKKTPEKPAVEAVVVGTESVAVATVETINSGPLLSGSLEPQAVAMVSSETSGTVTAVLAREGQIVGDGTLLARIDDPSAASAEQSARTMVQSAQTSVVVAQRDVERAQMLAGAGAVPKRDVDVAHAQLSNARAQLDAARAQLSMAIERTANQVVRASTAGTVSQKQVSQGDIVSPGTPLFTIVDLQTLQLVASVPAEALRAVQPGDPVEFTVRGFGSSRFAGRVTRIAPTVDPASGQVQVYASIANERSELVGGLFAEGSVTTISRSATVVPLTAVEESGSVTTVTVVRNGVAQRVGVALGIRNERTGKVEVVKGVSPGETVLIGPSRAITPGTRVSVGNVVKTASRS